MMAVWFPKQIKLISDIFRPQLVGAPQNIFRVRVPSLCQVSTMSTQPQVFVTRSRTSFPAPMLEKLEAGCSVSYWKEDKPIPRQELILHIQGKDALLCLLTDKLDEEVLHHADKLQVVATMSVGFDHLDLKKLKERHIKVGYTPGVLTDATADLTVSLLLATSRRLLEGNCAVLEGSWPAWSPLWMCGPALSSSTVGIVGLGTIGSAVMRRLKPFGVSRFVYSGRTRKDSAREDGAEFVPFEELLQVCDFVIVTCSYSPELANMFDSRAFSLMKKTSVLINTSRGGVINQEDLVEALTNGKIFAAGLDVMTPEPLPTNHPLTKLSNCLLIPHLGSATIQTRHKMMEMTVENLLAGLQDRPMPAQL